jgi:hypothetical protein
MGDEALVLGQTRPAQVTARLGRPFRQSVLSRHGKEVQVASYSHASARAEAALEGAMPARVQNFYFADGRLVGHEFASSFRDDSTDFDLARAARIRKGATTRAGVLYLLGAPAGRYIYPMTAHAGEEAFVYLYSHVTGQGPTARRSSSRSTRAAWSATRSSRSPERRRLRLGGNGQRARRPVPRRLPAG